MSSRSNDMADVDRRYWKPVQAYLRRASANSDEEADALAQSFFLWLPHINPPLGGQSSRDYLKTALRDFVGRAAFRLEECDRTFDREWVGAILERALDRVRRCFASCGRETYLQIFERHDLAPSGRRPSYAELAGEFGLTLREVRNSLVAVREAIRHEARAELSEVAAGRLEFEEEWNALFRAGSAGSAAV
ncbi:MAG: hypothetical protein HYY16_15940 [Planctomycetes bacterium]|nr:hypothetical protein [Planctomycetota bacterium]